MEEDEELDDEITVEDTVLDDIGPIDDPDEIEIIDSETEHDEDEPEVEEPTGFENDLFDDAEIEQAEASDDEAEIEEELDDIGALAKISSDEFTCTRCYLIRDKSFLSKNAKKNAPYCIYCE